MDVVAILIQQGGFAIIAGIFLWLYLGEKKDHSETRKRYEASLEVRITDAKETTESVTVPLSQMAQGIKLLSDKIIIGKGEK